MLQDAQALTDFSRSADTDVLAHNETLKIVACPICQAVYLPASVQQATAQSSCTALEAAFLRVCHFCFRCQQPACPQCWNPVHHVCTACGEEAHLPFLSPVPSLEGLVFAPPVFPHLAQTADLLFACLRNGRFSLAKPAFAENIQPASPVAFSPCSEPLTLVKPLDVQTISLTPIVKPLTEQAVPLTPIRLPVVVPVEQAAPLPNPAYPSWLQEIMGHRAEGQVVEQAPIADDQQSQPMVSSQESTAFWCVDAEPVQPSDTDTDTAWPVWWQEAYTSPQRAGSFDNTLAEVSVQAQRTSSSKATLAEAIANVPRRQSSAMTLVEWVENVLIVILSVILLVLLVIIVLAMRSASMNDLFLHLLHVDIRTEIAYLFQAI
ncbi:MAG: hypothetical protein ABI234_17760 [Ktedonobacteraceae bacterium]